MNFQGLIKNKVEFPEVIKKMEFPAVLVLGLKISRVCERNLKNDFLGNFSWLSNALNTQPQQCL